MEGWRLETDREAIAWWLRRLLKARGLRRELARRVPVAPEHLSRLFSPEDPARASPSTARRIAEALQELLREKGIILTLEDADLAAEYLQGKFRFVAVRPGPWEDAPPSDEELQGRAEALLRLYRRTGTILNAPGGPLSFRNDYFAMRREAFALAREAEILRRSGRRSTALLEAELCALAIAGLACSGLGQYGRALILTARAWKWGLEALEHPEESIRGSEEDRRRLGHHLFRALESHLVVLYNLGEQAATAQGYEMGLERMSRLQAFLPSDLLISWSLDYRLNRLHAQARTGRLSLREARRMYEDLREAIARGPVLPDDFPAPAEEVARRRMEVYAWRGWAKTVLVRSRSPYALGPVALEGASLLDKDLGLPLRIAVNRTLAILYRQAGDLEGWFLFAGEAARLAHEAGLLHHLIRIRMEFGREAERLLERLGLPIRELDES